MTATDTLTRPVEQASTDDPTLTHIVNCPPEKESSAAWLTEARVFGLPVRALCGHTWVPSRDPEKHPVCQACVDAADAIVAEVNARYGGGA